MKTKKPFLRLVALAALSFFTGNEVVAQTTVGSACGCPNYATRVSNGVININTVGTWTTIPNAYGKELAGSQNILLTCDKIWQIDEKLYIGSGSTITIEPGTIIKGTSAGTNVAAARALIIERGGKIIAPGTQDCPIIFTADSDVLDGALGVQNKGLWGGVLICGKATNNLTLSANGPFIPGQTGKLAVADGLGVLEGFATSIPQDQFGVATSTPSTIYTNSTSNPSTIPTGNYSFAVATGTNPSGEVANTLGQTKITLAPGTSVSNYYFVGMGISGTGIPTGTTIAGISTSSPYSSSNQRITLSQNTDAIVSGNLTLTGTYPAVNPSGIYYTVTALPSFASGTGPFATEGSTIVNYAAPYYAQTGSTTAFDDNDNSGVMTYVSIRHSGANLLVGSEINGLTLASVGRGTKIEHIEIVSCADDNIEIFGGTVNLKYCTTMFGNDDMFDYDLGWKGKAQFLFGMKANQFTTGTTSSNISADNDNGFEADSDDSQSYNSPRSIPVIYNATLIGNDKIALSSDNTGIAAIMAKENTGGEIYNSLFANWRNGFNMKSAMGSKSAYYKGGEAWHNWTNTGSNTVITVLSTNSATGTSLTLNGTPSSTLAVGMSVSGTGITEGTTIASISGTAPAQVITLSATSTALMTGSYKFAVCSPTVGNGSQILKVKCNTFVNNMSTGTPLVASLDAGATSGNALSTADLTQFNGDKNLEASSLTGFSPAFAIDGSTNVVSVKNDVVPAVQTAVALGTGCSQAPMDGFFEPANYRGAFKPGTSNDNWLSDWSYSQVLGSTKGTAACPADINNDGVVNITDFGIFAPAYGNTCN